MQQAADIAAFIVRDRQQNELLTGATEHGLAELGCALAINLDDARLAALLKRLQTNGLGKDALEAALIHAIGYLGAPRVQHALDIWAGQLIPPSAEIPPAELIPADRQQRVDLGKRLYDQFDSGRAERQSKTFGQLSSEYYPRALEVSGLTLQSNAISLRQRQCMTVAILACLGIEPQLAFHIGVAKRQGLTAKDITGVLLYVQAYAGMPRANGAAMLALEVYRPQK